MKRPLVIGIGGAHSGAGKTTLAVALLEHLASSGGRWGAVKYTKTAIYSSVIDDREVLGQKDKDTGRLLSAGAAEVLWIQAPEQELGEVLPLAMSRLSGLDGVIVEGNSAIEFLRPDVVVFLSGDSHGRLKASGERLLAMADIVIGNPLEKGPQMKSSVSVFPESPDIVKLMETITTAAEKKEIEGMLREKAVDGRISCREARLVAEALGVPYKRVGAAANRLKIKIKECELGCF